MSKFIGNLDTRLIRDDFHGLFQLLSPLSYQSDLAKQTFTAPIGFQSDFCSVPSVPGVYEMLGNRFREAGAIHDYLYFAKPVEREMADAVLREMILLLGASKEEAEAFYLAVREFGWTRW
jgi:hypothetical protein